MTKQVKVYALVEPNKGPLRYVGQTTNDLNIRLSQHICAAQRENKTYLHKWINKLLRQELKPNIILLQPNAELHISEQKWIKKLFDAGFRLTNLSDGGDGNPGYVHSKATKAKIAKALKGNKNGLNRQWIPDENFRQKCRENNIGEKNPNFGKPRKEETKLKIGSSQPNKRKVCCVETEEIFQSLNDAGRNKSVAYQNIRAVCEGKRKKAGKLTWQYS